MNQDTQKLIGTLLDETAQRDAIHVAVAPLVAGEDLWADDEVGLAWGTNDVALARYQAYGFNPVGIVDPFLKEGVPKGRRFFCFLFPGTVTGMRHHWSHPALDAPPLPPQDEATRWLREFADKWNFDYDDMIAQATNAKGGYVTALGKDLHGAGQLDPGEEAIFWRHLAALTGREFPREHQDKVIWSCSC